MKQTRIVPTGKLRLGWQAPIGSNRLGGVEGVQSGAPFQHADYGEAWVCWYQADIDEGDLTDELHFAVTKLARGYVVPLANIETVTK